MVIFFSWIVVGPLVGYYIGNTRDNGPVGSIVGLVLGPLGWLLLFLEDKRPQCGQCGGRIVRGARKCMHCGSELENFVTVKCPACGERGPVKETRVSINDDVTCPKCKNVFKTAANVYRK